MKLVSAIITTLGRLSLFLRISLNISTYPSDCQKALAAE